MGDLVWLVWDRWHLKGMFADLADANRRQGDVRAELATESFVDLQWSQVRDYFPKFDPGLLEDCAFMAAVANDPFPGSGPCSRVETTARPRPRLAPEATPSLRDATVGG